LEISNDNLMLPSTRLWDVLIIAVSAAYNHLSRLERECWE